MSDCRVVDKPYPLSNLTREVPAVDRRHHAVLAYIIMQKRAEGRTTSRCSVKFICCSQPLLGRTQYPQPANVSISAAGLE